MFLLYNKKFQRERGAAIILLTLFILAFLTTITFIITKLMIQEIRASQDIKNSFKAYNMTVSGMEFGSYKYKTRDSWNPGGETTIISADQNLVYTTIFQNGEIVSKGQARELERQLGAQQIFGGLFQQVSSYGLNSCAVSRDTYVYCWGSNSNGQLGNGSSGIDSYVPILVLRGESATETNDNDGMYLKNIKSVSVGNQYACALSGAQGGTTTYAYCWGMNVDRQLGNDTDITSFVPVRVHDSVEVEPFDKQGSYLANISNISAGSHHTCVAANSGNAYCWGFDQIGELGNGAVDNGARVGVPKRVLAGAAHSDDKTGGPTFYLNNIKSISALGGNMVGSYTCALSNSSRVYCWGNNIHNISNSLLGIGLGIPAVDTPVRVSAAAGAPDNEAGFMYNIKEIGSGGVLHACAISRDITGNNVYCWGVNQSGALGDGTTTVRLMPIRVLNGDAVALDTIAGTFLGNIKNVSMGIGHTCVGSNDNSNNNAYCWGWQENGRLGNNVSVGDSQATPIRVDKGNSDVGDNDGTYLRNIKNIMAGNSHTCAVSNNNKGYCWGSDSVGQLGDDNDNIPASIPIPVRIFGG